MATNGKVEETDQPEGLWLVLYEFLPIQSILASLDLLSEQRWGPFYLKLGLMGGVIFLTSVWLILTLVFVLYPMTQLSGSATSILFGILSRIVLGSVIFFIYLWVISPSLSKITDADDVPDLSEHFLSRRGFALLGLFSFIGVVIIRYAIIETVLMTYNVASTSAPMLIGFGMALLIFDMLYFGGLMFGFGMLGFSWAYDKPDME